MNTTERNKILKSKSIELQAKLLYEQFKHIDFILSKLSDANDPIYRTAYELWTFVKLLNELK